MLLQDVYSSVTIDLCAGSMRARIRPVSIGD